MTAVVHAGSPGLWLLAWRRLRADRVAMVSLAVVSAFLLMLVLSASGLIVSDWEAEVGVNYAPPGFVAPTPASSETAAPAAPMQALPDNPFDPLVDDIRALRAQLAPAAAGTVAMYGVADPLADDMAQLRGATAAAGAGSLATAAGSGAVAHAGAGRRPTLPFGGDKWGHDVIKKTIKGGETSIVVGLVAALLAVSLGTLFGALSGYWGGVVDDCFNWFYSIFTAIPSVLMILAVAAVLQQKGVLTIVLILGLTGWTGPYRLIRAEYIKHKSREYVLAADAIGASHWSKMFSHIFPNVSHVALVQMSILVVGFIKAEVILSFLGFGVPVGVVSWGSMLNEAQNELILGRWWQLTAAAIAMALLVTAFSLFTDALRDALDPKVKR
ncbi:ABC-type dipeptide/oligopeptide/nickel transport system, permease component [Janthinobacterium sp. HH01]|uniref:ABC transporter permease n=1 Tax=Janthinobacterium sp. HH01 TaxID=1198452 RepID=UPI0002AEB299|nr:ABC transporter permease [Janthinobacterium sp. HH01]ELX12923.1 ABC-type dipeptide/oligopeptide/nickel transport system, permease component [Janthinobacterium sp. HH01]